MYNPFFRISHLYDRYDKYAWGSYFVLPDAARLVTASDLLAHPSLIPAAYRADSHRHLRSFRR